MKVAVLGSGPSGLLAAEACRQMGHEVMIFSRTKQPSPMGGSQYIHTAIPGITPTDPDGSVVFHKVGHAECYANKVYGDPNAPTSWDIFPTGSYPCWNLARVYESLHKLWVNHISVVDIDASWLGDYDRVDFFDLTFSAIPAKVLCTNPTHQFPFVEVAFESHRHVDSSLGDNYIYYSGDDKDSWYRSSHIFGRGFWEYGINSIPRDRLRDMFTGIKPLDTDCDCRPKLVRVGRFGEWKKGKLVHHAFQKTMDALEVLADVI